MKFKPFFIVISFTFLTLLFSELGVRLYFNKVLGFAPVEEGWTQFDSELGWVPGPGMSGKEGDATMNINLKGARGEEFEKSPSIHVLGDSFTFGARVNDDQTWPSYLEKLVNKEVANFGVCAYGVDQMYLRYKRLNGRDDIPKPDIVLVGLIEDNFYRSGLKKWITGQERPRFVKDSDGNWSPSKKHLEKVSTADETTFYDWETILFDWSRLWILNPYDGVSLLNKTPQLYNRGIEASLYLLEKLKTELERQDVELRLVLLTHHFDDYSIKEKLENKGLKLIDCGDIYQEAKHRIEGDGHPNPLGHQAYAECIANHL